MKKTLVALAVLATAGTAFAQNSISLTGNFGVGFQRTSTGGNKTHMAITDGGLTFAGKEDLGGGLAAGFTLNQDFFRWSNAGVAGNPGNSKLGDTTDVFLTLGGGFGSIKLGQWESLSAAWTAGNVAPLSTPDDLYSTNDSGYAGDIVQNSARDMRIAYTTPSFSGFKATVLFTDRTDNGANTAIEPTNEAGLSLGFAYGIGGFNAALSLKNLNVEDGNNYQLGGSYDFGVAKLGLGVDVKQRANFDDRMGYLVSVAAPIGPVTVGATYLQSDLTNDPAAYGIGVNYDISKRTAVNLSAGKFDGDFYEGTRQGMARLKLIHSF